MEIKNPIYNYEDIVWYVKDGELVSAKITNVKIQKTYTQITTYIMHNGDDMMEMHVFASPSAFFEVCRDKFTKQLDDIKEYGEDVHKTGKYTLYFDFERLYS